MENNTAANGGGFVPRMVFFTHGVGRHKDKLTSFEYALRDAGIAPFNLVTVSSILPPHTRIVQREDGLKSLKPGQIVFVVMSRNQDNEPNRLMAASVGAAVPADRDNYGYLSEHHAFGQNEKVAGDLAEDLAVEMLASTLGLEFDEDKSWDENKEIYKLHDKIVRTSNTTQSAVIGPEGNFSTVIAAAVFLF